MYFKRYRPLSQAAARARSDKEPRADLRGIHAPGRYRLAGMLALGIAVGSACSGSGPRPGDVSDSTFVAAMADLRRAVQPNGPELARDSAGRQAIRDSIMRKYHITPAALESTAAHLADRRGHGTEILRAIDRKMQSK